MQNIDRSNLRRRIQVLGKRLKAPRMQRKLNQLMGRVGLADGITPSDFKLVSGFVDALAAHLHVLAQLNGALLGDRRAAARR